MKTLYTFFAGVSPLNTGFQVNRDKISKSEVNTWGDLLKSKYKGKFGVYYPRGPANFSIAMACLRPGFKSDSEWEGFVNKLLAQQPVAGRRGRGVADWIINGRYDIVVGAGGSYMDRVKRKLKKNIEACLSGYHPHPLYVVCLLGLQARAGAGALRRRSG